MFKKDKRERLLKSSHCRLRAGKKKKNAKTKSTLSQGNKETIDKFDDFRPIQI